MVRHGVSSGLVGLLDWLHGEASAVLSAEELLRLLHERLELLVTAVLGSVAVPIIRTRL